MNISRRSSFVLLLLYVALTVTTAYASIVASKALTANVTIQSATPGLTVLDSPNCSVELTSIAFPSLGPNPNDNSGVFVCIKNTGNVNFWLLQNPPSIIFSGLPPGVATQGGTFSQFQLGPSAALLGVTLLLQNDGTAPAGSITFTITFRGYSTSTG